VSPPTYCDWVGLYLRYAAIHEPESFCSIYDKYVGEAEGAVSGSDVVDVAEEEEVEFNFKSIDTELYLEAIGLIDLFVHGVQSLNFAASLSSAAALFVCMRRNLYFDADIEVNGRFL
jgi:hypothetical protein